MAKKKKETIVDKNVDMVVEELVEKEYETTENDETVADTPKEKEVVLEVKNGDASVVAPKEEENKPKEEKKNRNLFDLFKGYNFSDSWNGQVIDL